MANTTKLCIEPALLKRAFVQSAMQAKKLDPVRAASTHWLITGGLTISQWIPRGTALCHCYTHILLLLVHQHLSWIPRTSWSQVTINTYAVYTGRRHQRFGQVSSLPLHSTFTEELNSSYINGFMDIELGVLDNIYQSTELFCTPMRSLNGAGTMRMLIDQRCQLYDYSTTDHTLLYEWPRWQWGYWLLVSHHRGLYGIVLLNTHASLTSLSARFVTLRFLLQLSDDVLSPRHRIKYFIHLEQYDDVII